MLCEALDSILDTANKGGGGAPLQMRTTSILMWYFVNYILVFTQGNYDLYIILELSLFESEEKIAVSTTHGDTLESKKLKPVMMAYTCSLALWEMR